MERIANEQITFIRETLIGKRVRARDIIGVCEFFGYNDFFPSWKLQVTIGRLPVTHLELSDIELVD
jgi:hypothetical protein